MLPLAQKQQLYALIFVQVTGQLKPDIHIDNKSADGEYLDPLVTLSRQLSSLVAARADYLSDIAQIALQQRQQLARDLHDEVSQTLFSANLMVKSTTKIWHKDPQKIGGYLDEFGLLTQSALTEMRAVLTGLRPDIIANNRHYTGVADTKAIDTDTFDIKANVNIKLLLNALAQQCINRHGLMVSTNIQISAVVEENIGLTFYRVAQEAINNIVKHSKAGAIHLALYEENNQLILAIGDDGIGFDLKTRKESAMGLMMMQERAAEIKAQLVIVSNQQKHHKPAQYQTQGTKITLSWQPQEPLYARSHA